MRRYNSRMGRFYIEGHMIEDIRGGVGGPPFQRALALMSQIFVLEARHMGYTDGIEYVGVSPLFEELSEGERIPEYILEGQIIEEYRDGEAYSRYEVKAFRRCARCSYCGAAQK